METTLLFIILAFVAIGFYILLRQMNKKKEGSEGLILLQNQVQELARAIDAKLGESAKAIREQFGESANVIREITKELTKVSEGHKQVINITDQLKSLQDVLKNPKQRGVLGEYYLQTVLENVLPPGTYQTQYEFKDGSIVDAAIFVKDKIIPVDSKFSLENYNRLLEARSESERIRLEDAFKNDLKMRIDETAKYIKPVESTMDFAFMFIPSEAIYYDLLVNKVGAVKANTRNLVEYAAKDKKVIIVSPTSFLAYLQTVLQGLRALQIEESAKEIKKRVEELGRHLISYETYMKKVGDHLSTTVNMYNSAQKEFGKIDKDIYKISGEGIGAEQKLIDRPEED